VKGRKVLLGRISLQVKWPEAVISQTVYEVVSGKVSSSFAHPQPGGPLYATPTCFSYCERGTRAVFLDHTKLDTHTHTSGRTPERMISSSQRPLTTQHTTNTIGEYPYPQRVSNPQSQQSSGRTLHGHQDRLHNL
jgi:hypothetical protein